MPELPEVETVRASLARDNDRQEGQSVSVSNGRIVRRHKTAKDFRAMIEGHSIRSVQRLGKNLVFGLENGTHLVIHLGMSGQLLRAKGPKDRNPSTRHVVFSFVQDGELRYVDPRTFGELYVSTPPARASRSRSRSSRASRSRRRSGAAKRSSRNWRTSASIPSRTRSAGTASPRSCAVRSTSLKVVLTIRTSSRASATSTPTRSSSPPDCATTANPNRSRPSRSDDCTERFPRPDRGDQARRLDAR